jgi:ubiquinone/menaquinone biosynthesis C-methylase UbiE
MKKSLSSIIPLFTTKEYKIKDNVISFIKNEDERPMWSKAVDDYYKNNELPVSLIYRANKTYKYKNNIVMQEYYKFITDTNGTVIDLASGPSGYFSPVFDLLNENSIFIITDASPSIIYAHSLANKRRSNVLIFDIDLDILLPIKDNCIDLFCGNLVSNVNGYKTLLQEVYCTLKMGGKAAFIELFFEEGTKTYNYLKNKDSLITSLNDYLRFCSLIGFNVIKTQFEREEIGKQKGDLLPIDENDKKMFYIIYLEKKNY